MSKLVKFYEETGRMAIDVSSADSAMIQGTTEGITDAVFSDFFLSMECPEGIRAEELTADIIGDHHKDWDSLDEFVETAAMTMRPDREFPAKGKDYCLLVDGTSIVSRLEEAISEDRYRLSSCAVVIYRGDRQKPLYFTNYDEGLDAWAKLCGEMGHPEAKYDDPPVTVNSYLN